MPINKNRVSYTIDLKEDLKQIPRKDRNKAAKKIAELIRNQILDYTEQGRSPVQGGQYTSILKNKRYRNFKRKTKGTTTADLRLKESMLNSLKTKVKGSKITLEIKGSKKDVAKASGHNKGDYNGGVKRQFLPDDSKGQSLKNPIREKIKAILESYRPDDSIDPIFLAYAEEERRKKNEDEIQEEVNDE